ncbi:DUF2381 family protein [Vitiosangium sp. GDMCC 1.1324]|uniref:DUF2381 family protein n=1 Tax=Vitiosangium sp. (strain GDMCC 1.1324) TaxID=2138576 RepID=UPI001E41C807|nr:DUF2381 family protein [Vitiosangium sp. GDMCC 1.1324]
MTGRAAAAQTQPPAREQQQRQVVVPSSPDEPVPEVRVAANTLTLFRFGSLIDKASVEVEGRATRFHFVDVGERLVALELAVEPGPGERLIVRVRYRDGASPAYATFALVSHPTLVDTLVEVMRRPRTPEVLEAKLAQYEANGPAMLVLSGQLDREGVQATEFQAVISSTNKSGLTSGMGMGYRAPRWMVVAVPINNLPGQKPWAPGSARLFSAEGTPLRVRLVQLQEKSQLQPGESGLVVVQADAPMSGKAPFRLELLDTEGGRLLSIHNVAL